jgi:hypothetical protein
VCLLNIAAQRKTWETPPAAVVNILRKRKLTGCEQREDALIMRIIRLYEPTLLLSINRTAGSGSKLFTGFTRGTNTF